MKKIINHWKYLYNQYMVIRKMSRVFKESPFLSPKRVIYFGERQWGTPYFVPKGFFSFKIHSLWWKDKFNSPRFEFLPMVSICLGPYQWVMKWSNPIDDGYEDDYWEQFLWYWKYCDEDYVRAERTWPWSSNGKSSWKNKYIKF